MTTAASVLRHTCLHNLHIEAGARMAPFAGWHMPIQFEGVIAEHMAVRTSAGIFDVSHMGVLCVEGPMAALDLQRLLSNDLGKLVDDGQAQYTLLTNQQGGIEDDLIVYRVSADLYTLVVNAANVAHDLGLLLAGVSDGTHVDDRSDQWAILALQGPAALDVLATHGIDLRGLHPFRFELIDRRGGQVFAATTGYTGERGCELLVPAADAPDLWSALAGDRRVARCGLAARDTLRLEMCYPLHGNDIDASTNAVEAGLSWVCGWSTEFVGRDALRELREAGPVRSLVAVRMDERGIPRRDCPVHAGGDRIGTVTSGTMSPSLGTGIALAYVRSDAAAPGVAISIDVRGKRYAAHVVEKPFYDRER